MALGMLPATAMIEVAVAQSNLCLMIYFAAIVISYNMF